MRFRGRQYTGRGVKVAVVDSGIRVRDPRLTERVVDGWSIQLSATGHARISTNFQDQQGHGTAVAAALVRSAPEAEVVAVRVLDSQLRTSAELVAAGIETACRHGCHIINLSLSTTDLGRSHVLRDVCANAAESGVVIVAACRAGGARGYPADLPDTVGVTTHRDCSFERFFFFEPSEFPRAHWGNLSGKFLAHDGATGGDDVAPYVGSGLATAHMAGRVACLREALPRASSLTLQRALQRAALIPSPDIGYG